jgi:ornithine decarboxylase
LEILYQPPKIGLLFTIEKYFFLKIVIARLMRILGSSVISFPCLKMNRNLIEKLAKENGTPILVMDHNLIKKNYQEFRERLPRVQAYYAVKANSEPAIVKTLYDEGCSFDVASMGEFELVLEVVKHLVPKDLQSFIWNKVIYANPAKKPDSLHFLDPYKPLLTYDCIEEMKKIKEHCPDAGVLLRIKVPNEGSVVQLSNKFGINHELAPGLIEETINNGIGVEGISFHTGSQCNNPNNFVKALEYVDYIFEKLDKRGITIGETISRGCPIKLVDIGGGFPVSYNGNEQNFGKLAEILNKEFDRLFPPDKVNIIAEPGRFMVANAGTAITSVILAKNSLSIPCYHIDDGIYHTFSGMIFDHMPIKLESVTQGELRECYVFGPTCDGLDTLSENLYISNAGKVKLPLLKEEDIVFARNMGAYTNASATHFNGYPPAKVIHINLK